MADLAALLRIEFSGWQHARVSDLDEYRIAARLEAAGVRLAAPPSEDAAPTHCVDCGHQWRDHGPSGCEVRYGRVADDGMCVCTEPRSEDAVPQPDPASRELRAAIEERDRLREALTGLPRLWWCSGWGTLNDKRHHGNADACAGESCGNVAYVRDVDLRAALLDPDPS